MNNISFGSSKVGYYETVAGGAGAGPGWHGRSGVHSHMTNTRITDPEILEKRLEVKGIKSLLFNDLYIDAMLLCAWGPGTQSSWSSSLCGPAQGARGSTAAETA